jgi:hypothetical protein
MTKWDMINLLTVFPESSSALDAVNRMISIDCFSFASLLVLYREDTVITDKEVVQFSTEQLFLLVSLVFEELIKRKSVKEFVTDKIVHDKEPLDSFHQKSTEEFRKEVNAALEELRLVSEEDAFEEIEEFPLEESEGSYLGLDEH